MTCLQLLEILAGLFVASLGLGLGLRFGLVWGIVGAVVGYPLGFYLGRVPYIRWLRAAVREVHAKSTEGLLASLRDGTTMTPQLALHELRDRGEDIHRELGVVIDMLESESEATRRRGWAALTSVFPDLAREIRGYRPTAPVSDCRERAANLRKEEQ